MSARNLRTPVKRVFCPFIANTKVNDTTMATGRVEVNRLRDFATAVYVAIGMPSADASIAADTLVQADLWGISRTA